MKKPNFPVVMLTAAIFRDTVLDIIVFAATIIAIPLGWLLGIIISFVYAGIYGVWFMMKSAGMQKRLISKMMVRVVIMVVISFIPILRFLIPENTLLVYFTYRQEMDEWKKHGKKKRKKKIRRRKKSRSSNNDHSSEYEEQEE